MHKDENNAIRYLMREMDPSEEMEFEKLVREDEDLLIEVESLRATKRKLSALPQKNPPNHLIKKISDDANQLQSQKLNKTKNAVFLLKGAVAATILLSAFTGGFYYYSAWFESPSSTNSTIENIEPWVDRNEIIRFSEDQQGRQSPAIQTDFTKSYEKLQLVSDPAANSSVNSDILLTGSSK